MLTIPVTSTVADLRLWAPAGSTIWFTTYDAADAPLETREVRSHTSTPQSLATLKGSGLTGTPVKVVYFVDAPTFVATVLSGPTEPTLPVAVLQPGVVYGAGTGYDHLNDSLSALAAIQQYSIPALEDYLLVCVGDPGTLRGHFVDIDGNMVGTGFYTAVIAEDTYSDFDDVAGGTIPTGAVGFIGAISDEAPLVAFAYKGGSPPDEADAVVYAGYIHPIETQGIVFGRA